MLSIVRPLNALPGSFCPCQPGFLTSISHYPIIAWQYQQVNQPPGLATVGAFRSMIHGGYNE
jgi:hypothetical protein